MTEPSPRKPAGRYAGVVARLTGANFLLVAFAFVTSPILARALGPTGRGEVAAIFAIVNLAPWVAEIGITAFLTREQARRAIPRGVLLGSTEPLALAASMVGVAAAVPVAHLVGRGRPAVVQFVEIGLLLLPLNVAGQTLYGLVVADQRWGLVMTARVLSTAGTTVAIVLLYAFGALTVESAAVTYIVLGIGVNVAYLPALRGSRPLRFVSAIARAGLAYGVRSWISTVATTANVNLDQVLMAGLVSSRQLGLYALAVTVSTGTSSLVAASSLALLPRVATGDYELAARACRITLMLVTAVNLAIALTSPLVVPVVFGTRFTPMIPMLIVLLAAHLFTVVGSVLGQSLLVAGNPTSAAHATVAGLVITVPALIIVLPSAGGLGAAWVSFASYAVTFYLVIRAARRQFVMSYRRMLLITQEDWHWLWIRVRRLRYSEA